MTECRQVPQSGGLNSPVKKCSSDNTKTDRIDSERFSVEFEAEREKRRYQECGVGDEGTDQFVTGMTAGLGRKEVAESATTHDIDPSNLMVAIGAAMGRAPVATNAGLAADTGAFMKGTSSPADEAFIDDPLSSRSSKRPWSAQSVNSDSRPALLKGDVRPGSQATANDETIDVEGLLANEDIGAPSGLVEVDKKSDLTLKTKGVLLSTDTVHSEKTSGGLPAIPARDMSDYMNLSRRMASEGVSSPRGFELTRNEGVDSTSSVVHGETPVSSVVASRESSSSPGNTNISLGGLEFQRRDGPVSTVPTIPVTPIGVSESNSHRALGDGIIWMISNNRGQAHFAVNPPDMGPISVSMSTRDDEVFIKMNVHDEATRVVVETGIARLRDALSNNGLALGNFEVNSREDGFESVERHTQRRNEDGDTSLVNEDETEKDTKNDNGDSLSEDDGLVDHYV